MNWASQCAAVLPCLNEAASIGSVIRGVRNYVSAIFVVDDGSRDGTAAVAERAGAEVLRHKTSQGKGAALRTGWRHARDRQFQWALSLDGDGQHAPEDIPLFFDRAEHSGASLVIGNRMTDSRHMPWLRRLVNRWMSRRLSQAAGQSVPDSQCGFRLMRLDRWAPLALHTTHFEVESEVLLAFIRAGFAVEFVPIRVIYKTEQSKIHPIKDTLRWFRWWKMQKSHINDRIDDQTDDKTKPKQSIQQF